MTREVDGVTTCALCGAPIDVPFGTKVRTIIEGVAGKPTERVMYVYDVEVHRCHNAPKRVPY